MRSSSTWHLTDAGERAVVIHDAQLSTAPLTATGPVRALTAEQRAGVKLTGTDEAVPTLDEVLQLVPLAARPMELHVELKADAE